MGTVLREGRHPGEYLLNEEEGNYARENITVAEGQVLEAGTVLGKVTADGTYAIYDNGASDGTQAAAGVLYDNVDASEGEVAAVAHVRGPLEVVSASLVWASGTSGGDKTAALADLRALGIIPR